MDFDDLQKAWQEQRAPDDGPYNAKRVRKMVSEARDLKNSLFLRDLFESMAGLFVGTLAVVGAFTLAHHAWPWLLAAGCDFSVVLFFILDRRLQRKYQPDASVKEGLESALRQVDHQVVLLRNVALWYLFPYALSGLLILGELWFQLAGSFGPWKYTVLLLILALMLAINVFVYWLNQWAVKNQLLPLRKDLEEALHDLDAPA